MENLELVTKAAELMKNSRLMNTLVLGYRLREKLRLRPIGRFFQLSRLDYYSDQTFIKHGQCAKNRIRQTKTNMAFGSRHNLRAGGHE